jgi:hypothetical protein
MVRAYTGFGCGDIFSDRTLDEVVAEPPEMPHLQEVLALDLATDPLVACEPHLAHPTDTEPAFSVYRPSVAGTCSIDFAIGIPTMRS